MIIFIFSEKEKKICSIFIFSLTFRSDFLGMYCVALVLDLFSGIIEDGSGSLFVDRILIRD